MISLHERGYLQNYAQTEYSGQGALVDLGCWLGSSCCALAEGLTQNQRVDSTRHKVHAYDRFIWEEWMNFPHLFQGTEFEGYFQPGQSFFPECQRLCRNFAENIQFHTGDLCELGWSGEPIEMLFVDAMKSWDLANSILRDFYPHLVPGLSIVVQQDFWSYHVYWLHLLTYRFRDYFEPILDVYESPSLVFRYKTAVPPEMLKRSYSLSDFQPPEIEAAFAYAESLVAAHKRPMIQLAKVRLYHQLQGEDGFEKALLDTSNLLYGLPNAEDLQRRLALALAPRPQSLRLWIRQKWDLWLTRFKARAGMG